MADDSLKAIIEKLSAKQRHVLGMIAINEDRGHPPTTIHSLMKKGLIIAHQEQIYGPGNTPIDRIPMTVTRYDVPIPVHIAWCEWCSENYREEDEVSSEQ
jgi:hypothetical protein